MEYREVDQSEIISEDVFYANSMGFNLNEDELILTFERRIPGVKPASQTIVVNPKAMKALRDGMDGLINFYQETYVNENVNENDRD
ncbi:hypothetical protein N039_12380 [Staphylococcus sp. EGD-HP3]|uniref:hypothetical protein n=1 Tax=Staphylococcus sp. EGD-HP3 TaxID=1357269 RepID=UPI000390E317|nr:hypothetical protein [Staphylococcus sp. EGD-HP3]ERF48754.1 hypothetical protein N039_12380 [Staphylococcus sp. EGD-HP3]